MRGGPDQNEQVPGQGRSSLREENNVYVPYSNRVWPQGSGLCTVWSLLSPGLYPDSPMHRPWAGSGLAVHGWELPCPIQ